MLKGVDCALNDSIGCKISTHDIKANFHILKFIWLKIRL
jgi:hypothetical protein